MDKLEPSASIGLSNVNRGAFGVIAPDSRWSPSPSIPTSSSFAVGDIRLVSSTRYERLSASQSLASSCNSNGSRFDRSVPESTADVIPMWLRQCNFYVQSVASWGMIETAFRTSLSPTFEMSTPSILIEPDTSSTRRNRATIIDDLPAPVLKVINGRSGKKKSYLPPDNSYFISPLLRSY
jgi:hypothetical protein